MKTRIESGFGFSLEEFNLGQEYLLAVDQSSYVEKADRIIEGQLIVFNNISKKFIDGNIKYDGKSFDWNVQVTQSPNSFQMCLHSLSILVILSAAYLTKCKEENREVESDSQSYLSTALKLFYSWVEFAGETIDIKKNSFLWNDHAVALRAENIIFFALVVQSAGMMDDELRQVIFRVLNLQGEYLSNEKFYFKNNNHGIFQDRSLIYTAYFLNVTKSTQWVKIAEQRLQKQKDFAFNVENVHVENSPAYHVVVMNLFKQIAEFLKQFGDVFGEKLYNDIISSAEFMVYMLKPNRRMAEVGDTDGGLGGYLRLTRGDDLFHNPRLTYAATLGERGEKPAANKAVFKKSGYYVYREHWNKSQMQNATWIMFKSGFVSRSHKHSDDLSFMLYTKGHDVFIDPGWYNYMWGDRYRSYLTSSKAHNTITVDNENYSATDENNYKTGMLISRQGNVYDYLLGFNDAYHGVKIDRHFYSIGNAILLFDNIKSNDKHTYSQMFHLSQTVRIIKSEDKEVLISVGESHFVRIRQLLGAPELSLHTGDFKNEECGYISRGFNHIDSTTCLRFSAKGTNCDFITLITIEDSQGVLGDINDLIFKENSKTLTFTKGTQEHEITLCERPRFDISKVLVEKLGNDKFRFINQSEAPEGTEFAWYLIDNKSRRVVTKTPYLKENVYEQEIPPCENDSYFLLKAYMRNSLFQRKQQIVASIKPDEYTNEFSVEIPRKYELVIREKLCEKIGELFYRFTVKYDYFGDVRIQWLIYKDGGAKESFYINNSESMEYQFEESGNYTVMFYLRTNGGDNEFYIFPSMEV